MIDHSASAIEGPRTDTDDPRLVPLRARYVTAQLAGDRQEALRLMREEGLARGIDAPRLALDVIMPAQQEIGRLWQENAITVSSESGSPNPSTGASGLSSKFHTRESCANAGAASASARKMMMRCRAMAEAVAHC